MFTTAAGQEQSMSTNTTEMQETLEAQLMSRMCRRGRNDTDIER
jgi:hypothetical protein